MYFTLQLIHPLQQVGFQVKFQTAMGHTQNQVKWLYTYSLSHSLLRSRFSRCHTTLNPHPPSPKKRLRKRLTYVQDWTQLLSYWTELCTIWRTFNDEDTWWCLSWGSASTWIYSPVHISPLYKNVQWNQNRVPKALPGEIWKRSFIFLRLNLPSTLICHENALPIGGSWKRSFISTVRPATVHTNPSQKTGLLENALQTGGIWKRRFWKTMSFSNDGDCWIFKFLRRGVNRKHDVFSEWKRRFKITPV